MFALFLLRFLLIVLPFRLVRAAAAFVFCFVFPGLGLFLLIFASFLLRFLLIVLLLRVVRAAAAFVLCFVFFGFGWGELEPSFL